MTDVERWINLEGPAPEGVRRLVDAMRVAPEQTPDDAPRRKRDILAALAEQDRQLDREERRRRWITGAVFAVAAALAAAAGFWFAAARHDGVPGVGPAPAPTAVRPSKSGSPVPASTSSPRAVPSAAPSSAP